MSILIVYVLTVSIIKVKDIEIYSKDTANTKIYEIWHVETFEGGGKSRISYIKNIARKLEKDNDGVLFMIKSIDPASVSNLLSTSSPDIISFGFGVGDVILPYLLPFTSTHNVRDELVASGSYDRKLYAIPYIVSGYALFRHSMDNTTFHCGQNEYISPDNIYTSLNYQPIEEDQYDAYKSFVYNKDSILLGTGRDLFRINNLNNVGRTNAIIEPINTYTDLIQYISITKHDSMIEKFISDIFSIENQSALTEYSLFSALDIKLYHSGIYNDMENAIRESNVARVFSRS